MAGADPHRERRVRLWTSLVWGVGLSVGVLVTAIMIARAAQQRTSVFFETPAGAVVLPAANGLPLGLAYHRIAAGAWPSSGEELVARIEADLASGAISEEFASRFGLDPDLIAVDLMSYRIEPAFGELGLEWLRILDPEDLPVSTVAVDLSLYPLATVDDVATAERRVDTAVLEQIRRHLDHAAANEGRHLWMTDAEEETPRTSADPGRHLMPRRTSSAMIQRTTRL